MTKDNEDDDGYRIFSLLISPPQIDYLLLHLDTTLTGQRRSTSLHPFVIAFCHESVAPYKFHLCPPTFISAIDSSQHYSGNISVCRGPRLEKPTLQHVQTLLPLVLCHKSLSIKCNK